MKIVLFFLLSHKHVKIAFLRVSGNLCLAFENFHIGTNIWSVSGNFQHVSGNFDHTKILYFFISFDTTNFQIALSFWHVSVSFDRLLGNFQISKKFWPLSKKFSLCVQIFFVNKDEYFLSYAKKNWRVL